jgi:hypothetical protein
MRARRLAIAGLAVAFALAAWQQCAAVPALAGTTGTVGEAPVTTVAGADERWHNGDVTLAFTAQVASGSVTAIQVRVDGGEVRETPGAACQLKVAAPADHSGDGPHLVEFRAVDADGDVEEWRSVTVRIDTRRPSAILPHAVGVMRTCTARIDFRVADEAPGAGAADVTVVISTWDGHAVKTLRLRGQSTGVDHTARFTCDLPRGFYRVRLSARDAAGNPATAVAHTRLVVMRWMRLHSFGARMVGLGQLVYTTVTPIPRVDSLPHDRFGVRMYLSGGRLYNYPGGQARYGLQNLNTYRLTGDDFYLHPAAAQAQRLLDTHISVGGGWFYPLRFSRYRHSKTDNGELMRSPWYGGMAQGQGLSLMVSMYEVTGEKRYLSAAKATLNSFLRKGPVPGPWVVTLDGAQRLWIQEWPRLPLDYTYNGHMIATFGLYDYYRVTKDTTALLLFRAAASAALDYAPKFRRPGRISAYCLLRRTPNDKYHGIHIACFRHLADYTGEEAFRSWAEVYLQDYPDSSGLQSRASSDVDLLDLLSDETQQSP